MTSATADPDSEDTVERANHKTRLRPGLWIATALIFAAQVGLLFWFGNPPATSRIRLPDPPVVHAIPRGSEELLALQDPTLFVLPHRDNFSGEAWLKIPAQEFAPTNWTEPALPLPLSPKELGAAFATFMGTNVAPRFHPRIGSALDGADLGPEPMEAIGNSSTLKVEGDLAHLHLLTLLRLPPQTSADLLTNTVVQVLVDAQGYPFSAVVLTGSGSPAADNDALALAKTVRFEPKQAAALGTVPPDTMTLGKLIFEWQTLPPPPTNAPPAHP